MAGAMVHGNHPFSVRMIAASHAKDTLNISISERVNEAMDGGFALTRCSFCFSYLHETCLCSQIEKTRGYPSDLSVILVLALSEISNEGHSPKNKDLLRILLGQKKSSYLGVTNLC